MERVYKLAAPVEVHTKIRSTNMAIITEVDYTQKVERFFY